MARPGKADPLRGVLRPFRPRATPRPVPSRKPRWPAPWQPDWLDRLLRWPGPPIRPMTGAEFATALERAPYYRGRGLYISMAARLADDLIARHGLRSALELGPHLRTVVTGADVMVLEDLGGPEGARSQVLHDATQTPWPFPDRAYDLFVGLQVFEHLGAAQPMAFAEVARVARHAIISLPIDWDLPDPSDIHHMIRHEQVLAWFAPRVPTRIVEGNPGPRRRVMYVFEHLDRPAVGGPVPPIEVPAGTVSGDGAAARPAVSA